MEPTDTLAARLSDFSLSLTTFEQSLQLEMKKYEGVELDTIKTGRYRNLNIVLNFAGKL